MRSSPADPHRLFFGLFSVGLLAAFAVVALNCEVVVPRHGWNKKWGPMVPHETFPGECSLCHVPERWDVLREDFSFDHAKETGHPLEGAHANAACLRCHNDRGPVAVYAARGCRGCHFDPHKATLGPDCSRCHGESSWNPTGLIADHARTRFPLVGMHAVTPCESCHPLSKVGEFRGVPTDCALCHSDDLARATSPDHLASGWTSGCERCHSSRGWGGSNFQHSFFPLNGAHGALACDSCHAGGVFTGLSSDCYSCHQDDYQAAPGHVAQSFSTNCLQCHSTAGWGGAVFNHRFPLRGPHDKTCDTCHQGGNTSTFTCLVCHEHNRTKMDDKHKEERGYSYDSQRCVQCHPNGK